MECRQAWNWAKSGVRHPPAKEAKDFGNVKVYWNPNPAQTTAVCNTVRRKVNDSIGDWNIAINARHRQSIYAVRSLITWLYRDS
jgi:hypothetical protein